MKKCCNYKFLIPLIGLVGLFSCKGSSGTEKKVNKKVGNPLTDNPSVSVGAKKADDTTPTSVEDKRNDTTPSSGAPTADATTPTSPSLSGFGKVVASLANRWAKWKQKRESRAQEKKIWEEIEKTLKAEQRGESYCDLLGETLTAMGKMVERRQNRVIEKIERAFTALDPKEAVRGIEMVINEIKMTIEELVKRVKEIEELRNGTKIGDKEEVEMRIKDIKNNVAKIKKIKNRATIVGKALIRVEEIVLMYLKFEGALDVLLMGGWMSGEVGLREGLIEKLKAAKAKIEAELNGATPT
ncbi:MAG: hypothetical protein LBD32_02620 [Cytophagales bacterium]|jgi:hypothetical protein|nr:hypothetical protein [Cytophagales bacterium]